MSRHFSCFVINPIGKPNEPDRVRTEAVWENILRPAFAAVERRTGCKINAVPEYDNHTARDISDEIVIKIIESDILIALIHGKSAHDFNPNVLYEVGIAHSAGRNDLIILVDDAQVTIKGIFDIGTRYQFAYTAEDLAPRPHGLSSATVAKVVGALEANLKNVGDVRATRIAFGNPALDALGNRHSEYHVIRKFNGTDPYENLPFAKWVEFFNNTDRQIGIMGVSLLQLLNSSNSWTLRDGTKVPFSTFLKFKALHDGVDVRLVIMDEDNPALPELLSGVVGGHDPEQLETVRAEIRRSTVQWRAHARNVEEEPIPDGVARKGSIQLIKLRRGIVNARISLTDRGIIVTPIFLHVELNGIGPALWASNTTSVFEFFKENFEYLIAQAAGSPSVEEAPAQRPATGPT
jgi:hypothetical protein